MSLTGIAFLIAFAAGCVLALGRHPIYGLVTYMGVFYLPPYLRWWGEALPNLRWSLLAAVVTLAAVQIHRTKLLSHGKLFSHSVVKWLLVLVVWMLIQLSWAINFDEQLDLLTYYVKFLVVIYFIYRIIDSEEKLLIFLRAHVVGCFVLGWTAYTQYEGGRFEDFGGAGGGDANSFGLQLVTGIFAASALFLAGKKWDKLAVFLSVPFIVNGVVTTISRSAFLAVSTGGLIYNYFTPKPYRRRVFVLSLLAIALFLILTNPIYWARMDSLKRAGEDVEGVDTGSGRLVLIEKQWDMFKAKPLGHGHRGTAYLSPAYLADQYLTGSAGSRGRSSHNTFMTMLVEHGLIGAAVYVAIVLWMIKSLRALWRRVRGTDGFFAVLVPTVAAILGCVTISDMFVDYVKLEVRLWFIAILMVMVDLSRKSTFEMLSSCDKPALASRRPRSDARRQSMRRPVAVGRGRTR